MGESPNPVVGTNPALTTRFVRALLVVFLLAALPAGVALIRLDDAAGALRVSDPSAARGALRGVRDGIVLGVVAVTATVTLGVAFSRRTRRAFHRLGTVFRQVAEGNLNVSATDTGFREVDDLSKDAARAFGRLREFDRLTTRRIRDERRVVDTLFATHPDGLALINAERRIAVANARFRNLVSREEADVGGRDVEEILGPEVLDAVRRVQAKRDPISVPWAESPPRPEGPLMAYVSAVPDEVDLAPRVLLRLAPPSEAA